MADRFGKNWKLEIENWKLKILKFFGYRSDEKPKGKQFYNLHFTMSCKAADG